MKERYASRGWKAFGLLRAFLNGCKPETITAYRQDLEDFQAFIQAPSLEQAASLLLARGQGEANALALDYKAHLMDRELAANTINRRLTALRSLVKLGRTLGLVSFSLEVQSVKADPYRDTRGPGRSGFRDMLDSLAKRKDPKGIRDGALLRCLFDLGLRRTSRWREKRCTAWTFPPVKSRASVMAAWRSHGAIP